MSNRDSEFWCWDDFDDEGNPVVRVLSESEILMSYKPLWESMMEKKFGRNFRIDYGDSDCIRDFVVTNFAWKRK